MATLWREAAKRLAEGAAAAFLAAIAAESAGYAWRRMTHTEKDDEQ